MHKNELVLWQFNRVLVSVQHQANSLKNPVRNMVSGGQVSIKHKPHPHGVTTLRSSVDRSTESILQKYGTNKTTTTTV